MCNSANKTNKQTKTIGIYNMFGNYNHYNERTQTLKSTWWFLPFPMELQNRQNESILLEIMTVRGQFGGIRGSTFYYLI